MKAVLDFIMLGGFILFLVFLVRGFVLQVQERQKQRDMRKNKGAKEDV